MGWIAPAIGGVLGAFLGSNFIGGWLGVLIGGGIGALGATLIKNTFFPSTPEGGEYGPGRGLAGGPPNELSAAAARKMDADLAAKKAREELAASDETKREDETSRTDLRGKDDASRLRAAKEKADRIARMERASGWSGSPDRGTEEIPLPPSADTEVTIPPPSTVLPDKSSPLVVQRKTDGLVPLRGEDGKLYVVETSTDPSALTKKMGDNNWRWTNAPPPVPASEKLLFVHDDSGPAVFHGGYGTIRGGWVHLKPLSPTMEKRMTQWMSDNNIEPTVFIESKFKRFVSSGEGTGITLPDYRKMQQGTLERMPAVEKTTYRDPAEKDKIRDLVGDFRTGEKGGTGDFAPYGKVDRGGKGGFGSAPV